MRLRRVLPWSVLISMMTGLVAVANGDPSLIDAVRRADLSTVRTLIKQRIDINAATGDGSTALHWAAHLDDVAAVDVLLSAGANVNATNDLGVTPLFAAVPNGDVTLVQRLLAAGANPNATLPSGETSLMHAARAGKAGVARELLRKGASVDAAERERGQTALMWAAAGGHDEVIAVLLEHHANLNARSAIYTRRVLVGMRRGMKPPAGNGRTATDEQTGVIEKPMGGSTAFLFAAREGNIPVAKRLLAAGADPNDTLPDGTSALVLAAHSGHEEFALLLVELGANANADGAGYTPLHAAVLRSQPRLVDALLKHGADPNATLKQGTAMRYVSVDYALPANAIDATPVWLAAKYREPILLKALVAAGGNPRFALDDGSNAIIAALDSPIQAPGFYYTDVRSRYLSPTDQANRSSEEEEQRLLDTLTFLVEKGANVKATNPAGDTPLHLAAARGYNTIVRFLTAQGADINAKNKAEKAPIDMTNRPGQPQHPSTAQLLRSLGAKEG